MKVSPWRMRFIGMTSSFLPRAMAHIPRLPAGRPVCSLIVVSRLALFAICVMTGPRLGAEDAPKSSLQLQEEMLLARLRETADEDTKKGIRAELREVQARLEVQAKEKALAAAEKENKARTTPQSQDAVEQAKSRLTMAVDGEKAAKVKGELIKALTEAGPVAFIHGGVRLVSPYKFKLESAPKDAPAGTGPKGILETASKDDTATFLEFVYANRGAWNSLFLSRLADDAATKVGSAKDFLRLFDFETRLTYNFSEAKADATAIAGTGDFGGEVSLAAPVIPGINLHLHESGDASLGGWSIAPEFSYGVVTGKGDFDARERKFWGVGYTVSYNLGGREGADRRWLRFHAAVGRAKIDAVKFVDDKSKEVELINGTLPRYRAMNTTAFEADVIFPVSQEAHLTFGGRVYEGARPNSWTFYLGYTRPISKILSGLFPIGEDSAESKPAEKKDGGAAGRDAGTSSVGAPAGAPSKPRRVNTPSL